MAEAARGVDYSTRPSDWGLFFDKLKAKGYTVLGRYLYDFEDPKRVTVKELEAAWKRGFKVFFWFETSEAAALQGYDRGSSHAERALGELSRLGLPETTPVYYCVDFDASLYQLSNAVRNYFRGVRSIVPLAQVGVYGGYRAVKFLSEEGLVRYVAQTEAWSYLNGLWPTPPVWYPGAQIHQWTVRGPGSIGGVQCDGLDIVDDCGAYSPNEEATDVLTDLDREAIYYGCVRALSNQFDIAILEAKFEGNAARVKELEAKKAIDVAADRKRYGLA